MSPTDFILERKYLHNVSTATITWYEQAFKRFDGALESRSAVIARIGELRERGLSPVSINVHLRVINAYFRWLHIEHKKELIKLPKLKEEDKLITVLTPSDITKLLNYKPTKRSLVRAHLAALTILDTGLRASELLSLTKQEIDFDNLVFKVIGKGGKERLIPFSVELRKKLWRYCARSADRVVFGTQHDTEVSVRNFERDLKVLGDKIGVVKLHPHRIRHTFAVSYLKAGGNLEYLRKILGHTQLSTTQKYLRGLGIKDLSAVHSSLSPLSRGR